MISRGRARISIKRNVEVEWTEGIEEEILLRMLSRAVRLAEQKVDEDAS